MSIVADTNAGVRQRGLACGQNARRVLDTIHRKKRACRPSRPPRAHESRYNKRGGRSGSLKFRGAFAGFVDRVAHVIEIDRHRERLVGKDDHFLLLLEIEAQLLLVVVARDHVAALIIVRGAMHDGLGHADIEVSVDQDRDSIRAFFQLDAFLENAYIAIVAVLGQTDLDQMARIIRARNEARAPSTVLMDDPITNVAILGDLVAVQGQHVLIGCKRGRGRAKQQYGDGFGDSIHVSSPNFWPRYSRSGSSIRVVNASGPDDY